MAYSGAAYRWHDLGLQQPLSAAQLQKTLNALPAYTWYKLASGVLAFVNERSGDYLGLPKDHPLRHGIATGAAWDSHIFTPFTQTIRRWRVKPWAKVP